MTAPDYALPPSRDMREPRRGWAPGLYARKCFKCGDDFCGDKLSHMCAPCAYGEGEAAMPEDLNRLIPFEVYEAVRIAAETAVFAGERLQCLRDISRNSARQRAKDECVSSVWKTFDGALAAIRARANAKKEGGK